MLVLKKSWMVEWKTINVALCRCNFRSAFSVFLVFRACAKNERSKSHCAEADIEECSRSKTTSQPATKTHPAKQQLCEAGNNHHALTGECCLSAGYLSTTSAVIYTSRCCRMLDFTRCTWTKSPHV